MNPFYFENLLFNVYNYCITSYEIYLKMLIINKKINKQTNNYYNKYILPNLKIFNVNSAFICEEQSENLHEHYYQKLITKSFPLSNNNVIAVQYLPHYISENKLMYLLNNETQNFNRIIVGVNLISDDEINLNEMEYYKLFKVNKRTRFSKYFFYEKNKIFDDIENLEEYCLGSAFDLFFQMIKAIEKKNIFQEDINKLLLIRDKNKYKNHDYIRNKHSELIRENKRYLIRYLILKIVKWNGKIFSKITDNHTAYEYISRESVFQITLINKFFKTDRKYFPNIINK